jgi:hypothetical protein
MPGLVRPNVLLMLSTTSLLARQFQENEHATRNLSSRVLRVIVCCIIFMAAVSGSIDHMSVLTSQSLPADRDLRNTCNFVRPSTRGQSWARAGDTLDHAL